MITKLLITQYFVRLVLTYLETQ